MKRLILIQNDYPGAGKTTLRQCLHQYLESYRVPHHAVVLSESLDDVSGHPRIEASDLSMPLLSQHLRQSELVILEVDSGLGQHFSKFYEKHGLDTVLPEMGFDLTVVIPVTSEEESFDGVLAAADVYSDDAQYLVVHTPTSSFYDEDEKIWDKTYAARVMDLFEAADLDIPSCNDTLDYALKSHRTDLPNALENGSELNPELHAEVAKWFRRVSCHLDCVRKYLFGDAFRPAIALAPPTPSRRGPKAKSRSGSTAVAA